MALSFLIPFAAGALIFASGGLAALWAIMRLMGRWPGWRLGPAVFFTLCFIALTQHPFPDPETLSCPVRTATPQLTLFRYLEASERLLNSGAPLKAWLTDRTIAATMMNYLVCAAIGAGFALARARFWMTALFGAALTLAIELTQLTGFWGLWPCAWRQFNVDDLMLNFLGVTSGFLLFAPFLGRRSG